MSRYERINAALVLLALVLGALAYGIGSELGRQIPPIEGLRAFQSPRGERIALVHRQRLLIADPAGQLLSATDLASLGLRSPRAEWVYGTGPAGRFSAWVIDRGDDRIHRCTWDVRRERPLACSPLGARLDEGVESMTLDPVGRRLLVVDSRRGLLSAIDPDSGQLAPVVAPAQWPGAAGRMEATADGRIYVASKDRPVVTVYQSEVDGRLRWVERRALGEGRAYGMGHVASTSFGAAPGGAIWFLSPRAAGAGMELLRVRPGEALPDRVDLPQSSWPAGLAFASGTALVADQASASVHRLDPQGRLLGGFGASGFLAEFREARQQLRLASAARWGGLILGAAALCLGFLVHASLRRRRKAAPQSRPAVPPGSRAGRVASLLVSDEVASAHAAFVPVWPVVLKPTRAFELALTRHIRATSVMAVLLVALLWSVRRWQTGGGLYDGLVLELALFSLGLIGTIVLMLRLKRSPYVLRVKADRIGLYQNGTRIARAETRDLLASDTTLLIGGRLLRFGHLPFGDPKGPTMFDPDHLRAAVLDRLAPQQHVSEWLLLLRALRRQPRVTVLLGGALVAIALGAKGLAFLR